MVNAKTQIIQHIQTLSTVNSGVFFTWCMNIYISRLKIFPWAAKLVGFVVCNLRGECESYFIQ